MPFLIALALALYIYRSPRPARAASIALTVCGLIVIGMILLART